MGEMLEAMQNLIQEIQATMPPQPEPIKEILAGAELIGELRKLATHDSGPFTDPAKFCGVSVIERPESFPPGAYVMGVIMYVDPDRFPKLITRT